MPIKQVITEGERPVKVWTDQLDAYARAQLVNVSKLPFIHRHVAAMPDVHGGIGATIGSVIATHQAIIPAAVGVDRATQRLQTGQLVRLNGSSGIIELLEEQAISS